MKKAFFLIFIGYSLSVVSQNDTIRLNEVEVKGVKKTNKKIVGQKAVQITEEQVVKNPTTLTNLLRFNSPINFKDYGNGGVSSARFRGTSATNTLVLWNGIPINAFGNGQTDFNALSANTSDEIAVNSGGAGAKFGSGAIGGTIELNDKLDFKKHKKFHLFSSFGSFETTSNFFKSNIGLGKWAVKLASSVNYATNDYTYIDNRYKDSNEKLYKNENGRYKNFGINFGLGYKFSNTNKLFFYSSKYYGDRLFSAGLPNPASGSERNEDFNQRNLLQWQYNFSRFKQMVNLSFLTQEYRYYNDKNAEKYNFGASKTINVDYKLTYRLSNDLTFNSNLLYIRNIGKTDKIASKSRNVVAFVGGVVYNPFQKTKTFLSVRQEYNSDFSLPTSVYIGLEQKFLKNWLLTANFSRNYRVPTFNELYWVKVGNPFLVPEKSKQVEVGFQFNNNNFNIVSSAFYIHLTDKILWLPAGGSNLWRPKNIDKVANKGVETTVSFVSKIAQKHKISVSANYVFTIAKNKNNTKIVPYVPKHLFNFNTEYSVKWFTMYLQTLFQSKVYTNEININFYSLKRLLVNNIGANFHLFKRKNNSLNLGLKVNNVQNSVYYFTNLRPMPNRNFNTYINYKF